VRALLSSDITITARQYIGFEAESGYHHYNIDVAHYYEMEENYQCELYVRAISGNRITVSTLASGAITGNVDRKYLTKIATANPIKQETYTVYTVVKGDTLWGIAQKKLGSGSRYSEIVKLNNLKSSVIISGQKLKIPNK